MVAGTLPFTNLVSPSNSTVLAAPSRVFTDREWSVIAVTVPRRCSVQEFLLFLLFFTVSIAFRIRTLHAVKFVRGQAGQVADEDHQLPAVLVVVIAGLTPCRHARPANAVVDDVIKLAITELLGGRQPHVRRRRIEVLSNLGVAVAFVAMAGGAVIGKVPGRLLQNLGRRGNRISALRGARRQRPGAQPPCQSGFHPAGSLSRATAMRNQAGNPESSPQQQNDNQSSPEHTRHEYLSDSVLVAPP